MDSTSNVNRGFYSEKMEPLYFKSAKRTLFGWLHRPEEGQRWDVGLVICNPFGYEAICSHRSVRAFAEAGAALGAPSLRFDYSGTGDSDVVDGAEDQIELWISDIVAAVAAIRRLTRVNRVCLLGIRLGAMLAKLAIERCQGAQFLILIAPILSGRACFKEFHITHLAAQMLRRTSKDHAALGVRWKSEGFTYRGPLWGRSGR